MMAITRDVGLRGSMAALKAPDQMQLQEGMRGKPIHGILVVLKALDTVYGQPLACTVRWYRLDD
jgi:hypothetical protein